MKKLKKLISDWKRPYFQALSLVIFPLLFYVFGLTFDFDKVIAYIIDKYHIKISNMPTLVSFIISNARFFSTIVIFIVLLCFIRSKNSNVALNSDTNTYHSHTWIEYLFCRRILAYRKCRLKLVPIPMQFKLICSGLFEEFIYDEGIHQAPANDKVKITIHQYETSTVNIVISDTYKIEKNQIPNTIKLLTTYFIDRSSRDHTRYDSEKLVKEVISTVRNLPQAVVKINVLATTNPCNTYKIAKEAFCTGGRDTIKNLYVFSQEGNDGRNFVEKGMKIY